MNLTEQRTLADLVVEDFRAAGVLHGFGIDFCCSDGGAWCMAAQAGSSGGSAINKISQWPASASCRAA